MSDPIIQWLPNVPECPLIDGYKRDTVESRLISSVDAGLNKIRNRYLAVPTNTTESFIMSKSQYNDFMVWYENTLRRGALRFTKKDPITDSMKVYRVRSQPTVAPVSANKLKVTLELEIMP